MRDFPLNEDSSPPLRPDNPLPPSPLPPPFIPPPLPLYAQGQYPFIHPYNNLPSAGILSDPLAIVPLYPDRPFLSFFTLHLCQHMGFAHTQAFIGTIDLRMGKGYSNPTADLSWTITYRVGSQCQTVGRVQHEMVEKKNA